MPTKGTTPTQIRLTDQDKDTIDRIQRRFGLPSRAAAIRYAVETVGGQIGEEKKSRKSAKGA